MSTSRDDFGIVIRSALLQKGAKQKFSLLFLIFISILIFFLDSYPNIYMDKTRSFLNDSIYRVSSVATSPFKFFSYLNKITKKHFLVYEENKLLKKELEVLKAKDFKFEFLITENKKLKKVLDSENTTKYSSIAAKILIDKDSPYLKSLIINKGSKSNIKKGMPVVKENYLVGRIVEVNYLSSRVLLLNDLNSRIPVVINKTGVQAILTGKSEINPELMYLPETFEASSNDIVYTSGKDGLFYEGITVGTTEIIDGRVTVKLSADPNQLAFVNVIFSESNIAKEDY